MQLEGGPKKKGLRANRGKKKRQDEGGGGKKSTQKEKT